MQKGPAHWGEQDLFYYTKFNQHQLVSNATPPDGIIMLNDLTWFAPGQIFIENSGFFMKM